MEFKRIKLYLLRFFKREDTGLRGDYQGNLYVDKKVFYKRKCVRDNIASAKRPFKNQRY